MRNLGKDEKEEAFAIVLVLLGLLGCLVGIIYVIGGI